ncbi:hypothetical protein PHYSODRAFT_347818 [Phytophthora sojae]|uniref:Lysosomal Cystine Transporter (LCT) Family n=1 Tax=Phytophthora sojae (strain P6497) TaxID=1094619 RepID=G5A2Q0_PHYSP|nr:hypothetical protein PHYSODRAFT_347818 [Phytophthora sojae]EGZ09940.1 hypothetical protein PHYSODRAFT_347818 [Phytophthora sojae]|eukprot:XP_009534801.1 hypothetical protein PHYSODRAFT_347818 [Phytophthora sojae]
MDLATKHSATIVSAFILLAGLAFGLSLDANAHIPRPWNRVSSIIGWIYFFCWSVSFYPQAILNRQRRSVEGLSLDYAVLNMLGFARYTVFNVAFYYSESAQQQYMRRHGGHRNAVELNDVFFSLHAVVMVNVWLAQCVIYPRGGQTVSKPTILWTGGTVVVALLYGLVVLITGDKEDSITLNYQRKSTVGWTIWNVQLDFAGGLLSIAQQVLDAAATDDWAAMTGDPVKFLLGLVSIIADVVFFMQHNVFYAKNNCFVLRRREVKPLLPK